MVPTVIAVLPEPVIGSTIRVVSTGTNRGRTKALIQVLGAVWEMQAANLSGAGLKTQQKKRRENGRCSRETWGPHGTSRAGQFVGLDSLFYQMSQALASKGLHSIRQTCERLFDLDSFPSAATGPVSREASAAVSCSFLCLVLTNHTALLKFLRGSCWEALADGHWKCSLMRYPWLVGAMKPLEVGMIRLTTAWTNWTASRVPVMGKGLLTRKLEHRGGKDIAGGSVLGLQTQDMSLIPAHMEKVSVVVHAGKPICGGRVGAPWGSLHNGNPSYGGRVGAPWGSLSTWFDLTIDSKVHPLQHMVTTQVQSAYSLGTFHPHGGLGKKSVLSLKGSAGHVRRALWIQSTGLVGTSWVLQTS